ncbi:phage tail protein [Acinetobacter baumannii]|uniref:TipJ family phage tail tip protein n=1 Tax=Acinetobacter baumannii TaxID=470 RepID=UPI001FD21721|nr:phage tail protein [Acinetobacter baumannii]MDA5586366.1 phage tail protein [Acinetobacter baumannii]MDA5595986.1 phage tail protein [Acinetobacter baumannii]MDW5464365.1 phage tail protein [Acinetobacter baumannii]
MNAKIKKFGFPLPIAGASGGSKSPSVPREDPDNLQSSAYVNIIDLIGEGQIGGLVDNVDGDSLTEKEKSIFFDGTRLRHTNGELNFANVSWAERVGLQRQDYIEGFGEGVETPFYKNVQLKSGIPSAFTVSNPNADRVRIILAVNSLLSTDRSSGDTYGTSVEFQIKLSVNNGPYEILANKKITGKTTSRYQRSFSFDLPKKKADGTPITAWSFQITRTTPDSNSSYLQNTTFFESYSEVELTKFSYPNVALVATRFSSETFSSIPKREYLVDGLLIKVPSNRNKDGSYTGPWDGTFKLESSSNPAWILYDLLLSKRYGLGEYITPEMIDESRLYVIGQYCDQLVDDGFGNKEPRYTINCVINTRVEAYDLIVDICSAFNGMAYWAGHMVGFTIDAPGTPQMLFNNTNIVGDFSYQGTSNKDRHSVAVVTWNDPNDDYKQVPEVVEDPELIERYGIRKTEVMAFGCTSRGQAARYGRWLLYSEHQQSETITFNVGIDAALLLPGDLIYVQDRDRAGKRFGGRLLDCTAKQAVLDDLVDFGEFTDLTLVIRLEDGSLAERVIASHTKKTVTVSGHTKEVTVVEWAEALTVMPVKYALWIIKAAELQPVIARVVNVAQGEEKGTYNITAVPHNPNKYQSIENDLMLDVPPTSILNSRNQEPPASVEIKSEIITTQNVAKTRLVISWKEAKNAARYEVEWKRNDGNWVKLPQTTSLSIEVEDVYAGAYTARVVAYNLFGARSYPKYSTSTDVKGKVGKPTNVLSLTTTPLLFGMKLDWVYPAGNSDLSHVVIEVSDRADGSNPRLLGNVSYPTNTLTIQGLQGGLDQWYRTKTVDKSGNESDWSNFVKGTTGNDPDQVLDLISGQIGESDLATELQGKIENSVTVSEAAKIVADNAQTAATNAQTAATDAKTAASEAQKAASSAQTQASSAQQIASEASATAANAKNAADQAVTAATSASNVATTAKNAADTAKAMADSASTAAAKANTTATNAQTTADNAAAAASKVASDLTSSTNQLNQKIADEANARTTAISKLNDGLTTETSQRKSEDAALLSNIETYKSSTNGTLSSLQTQINTNATNTSANTSKITSLDSRLTTNEGKTADAINAAAAAQQTANTAVINSAATASALTSLKSELSTGKGINNIIAPFSDPQELSPYVIGASRTVALINSPMRINGKAYDVTFNAVAGSIYFGSSSVSTVNTAAAGVVSGGKRYMLSAYLKNIDPTKQAEVYFTLHWFRRTSEGAYSATQTVLVNQATNNTRVTPSNEGGTVSCKAVTAPVDAVAFTIICAGNSVYNVAGSRILIDMLMLEEVVGVDVPASTWTAGPTDLSAIKSALDANASAINNLKTRVTNAEGVITSQGDSITQLNNSVTSINGELTKKADATALNSLSNRVTTAEGQISSQGSAIVSLKNDLVAANNAISTKADSSALNSLDSKVTSIDGKVASNASAITSLKSELSTGKGANLLIAPYSDPQVVPYTLSNTGVEVSLVDSVLRTGKAYNFKNVTSNVGNYVYIGQYSNGKQAPVAVRGGSKLLFSFYAKSDVAGFIGRFALRVFNQSGANVQVVTLLWTSTQAQNVSFTTDLVKYTLYLSSPIHADGVTASILLYTGGASSTSLTPAGAILTMDKLMIEEYVGDNKEASPWVVGSADLNGIYNSLDASASAINNLTTRMANAEGSITSQSNSITSLRNDLATTNNVVSKKADASALTSLDTKVTSIDGRVTNNTSAVTALQGRVTTVENGLSTKADASALNNYYTKTEADSATSGAIDKFNSQLTIGGVNVVANSEAPRTSTAATKREYLLYERSAELKAFYDENLEKPITISFEMSVPVAGPVQVYSSNGSAHQFVTSVNAVIVNQFAKYSVTVSPKSHTASTTVSTIEFYGTYGTGRIPTIRKLQIEAGTKATAWSPSPRDTQAALDANASAIQNTQTKVENIDGRLTTATDSITSLNSRMSTAEGNINSANTAVGGLSTRMATAEGKITNQSDSIASLQNSVTSINGTLANKADSSAVNNLTSRVETAEGKISSQSGQITSLSNSLDLTNSNLNDVNVLARLLSLGKPLRDDPTFKSTTGGLAAYALQSGSSFTRQAKSTDNPMDSAYEMLLRATTTLGSGWYPNNPTVNGGPNKAFLVKQVIKMPIGQKLAAFNNTLGAGGYVRILGNAEGTGKFETYYSVIQCGPDANTAIQGHFRVINSSNPPVPSASNPVDVILASYEVFDVTAVNDTIPKAYSNAIAANANAINTLSNTVSQQGNTITSHSNSITQLNNSISSINGALSSKADASALQSLDSKVTLIDGKVTSNSSALTALQSSFDGLPNQGVNLLGPEISNPVEKPNWISGLPFEVIQSPDTANVRAFQFTMPAATGSGTYFNIGGGQAPRQWLTEGNYIFSFVARTVGGSAPHPINWLMYNVSVARLRFDITETLTRYSGVFTVPAGGAAACMLLIGNPAGKAAGQVINIERMMLERQVGNNTTPSAWVVGSDPTGMIISTQAKATDLFNTATSQNAATAGRVNSLESRMTTTEGNLNKKADASALQNLDTKVTNVDGKVTSNTNAITALSSTLSNATSSISMNAGNAQSDWTFFNTSGEYSIVAQADGQAGRVIQLGNNAGNDIVWMHPNNFIPFDATKTYRLRVRYRRRAGNGTIYVGVSQKTPDKALYVTTANALSGDMGSSNYVVNAHAPAIDEWQEIVAYIKGRSAGAASGSGSKTSPRTVSQQAGFITPMFIANYSAQTGIVELDYLILEDAEAIVANDANASAISALDTKVSEVDGRLTTATNSITSLNSRMSAAEGNISAANSALSGLSTRMTAAENGLTNQSNAITNLSNSLTVTTNTANAALPKIQGGTGAAKLFRGVLVWQQNGANLTGNIVIQTPITFTGKMFRLSLTGYNYLAAKNEINLNIGGYAYSGTSLLQHGVVNSGTMPIRVRMGIRNGTVVVILTSQAPGAYWQYPKFNIDAEIGYTTPPDSWSEGWSASFMAEADLASNGISAIIEPSLLDISTTLNATASAISNLTNTVSQQGDTITSHSNSITTLTNKITNNDLSNLVLNPDFVDPKSDWTSGVIVDATDAAPNPPSAKALRLNNRDSYYGPFVKCNVGDMFYVSAWFATPNTSATASAVLGFNTRNSAGTYTWYSVAIKSTDKNAWGMVEGYFTVPNGMVDIRPWLQVSIAASEAAGQQWHVTNIQVRNITGNKKLATDLQATSSALSTLDSKVTNIDGRVTSASNNIVSLNNSVTNINATLAQKADATALNSLSNRVTNAEGNITSQGNSITSLTNSLAVSGKGGTNLLIKSNVVGLYDGVSYPHHTYKLGEDWEIGAKYTLIWCAEHKRGTGDNNSYLAVYAGGGSQTLQSIVNTDGKVISKVTFVKNSAVASGPIIHFYMINRPTADKGTIGTVYWAVLVKGDVLTTDAWIPSPYDYIPDSNANAAAITNLTNTVTQQGNTLTSHTNSITSLNNSITSINGILNTKANTSAVSDLDSRVTDAEGKITANTSSITSLTANLKSTSNGITMSASIDVDPDSEWIYWTKNGEVARADDTTALGGKVYRFGNNAGNDHVNARSKAKLPFDQNKTYRIRARYRRVSGTGTIYCAVFGIAKDGVSHVNSSNTVTTDAGSSNYFVSNQAPALNVWQEVTVYVKGRAAGAATGGWTLDNPRQLPNATAFISVQFLANYSNAAGITELDYLIIEDADAIAANDATAKALSSLDTRVTTAEGKITSQGNSITQLNNSITTINGTLSSKADSSALNSLANRVSTAEGAISSQGSSITSLNASVNGLLKDVAVSDTRSTNQPPSWYWSNYPLRIVREFKQASVLGLTGMGTYVSLETYVYWTDASGGPIIQIARGTDSKLTAERRSTSTSTWGSWTQDIKTLTDGLANKAEASALSSLDAKVSTIDGKVSTQATSITNLQTTVGGHTASIQSQQQSIDGLKSRATLKLQSGNLIGGVGIENDSKTVDFIIQANKFAIAPPSDAAAGSVAPKYAFVYQPTATTLPNGTVVPAGLYLDNASIGYINAEKINASSLSALSANLGTLTTLKDPTKPNGARMVMTGSLTTVYDDNNVARIRLGIW